MKKKQKEFPMAIQRERPYGGFNFLVQLEGEDFLGYSEVILPEASVEVIEYRPGNFKENAPLKLTGPEHYTNLILKRGVNGSLNLYAWWNQVRNGDQNAERNVVVQLLNEDHSAVVVAWKFFRARPVKYYFSPLNGLEGSPVYETVELAVERMEME
jgi:phage tail-like protein